MAERFKFNDEEENIDENDNQQDDLEKEYYDNTDYSYTKSKSKISNVIKKVETLERPFFFFFFRFCLLSCYLFCFRSP